jgi:hypothetical protein
MVPGNGRTPLPADAGLRPPNPEVFITIKIVGNGRFTHSGLSDSNRGLPPRFGKKADPLRAGTFFGTNYGARKYTLGYMRRTGSQLRFGCMWAVIPLMCVLQVSLCAQQETKLSPKVMAAFNAPLVELKDDDPPLIRLKKERFNAALKEARARTDLYNRGLTRLPELIEMGERLFAAELDLYDQPERKAEILQRQLDVYIEAEANVEKWVRDGLVTDADLERLRYNKFSVQIALLKVKSGQGNREPNAQPTTQ